MVEKELGKDWLMGFESVNNWFGEMKRRRGGKEISRSQFVSKLSHIRLFVRFTRAGSDSEETPDSILEWAKTTDPIEVVNELGKYCLWLQGEKIEGYGIRSKVNRKGEVKYPKASKASAEQMTHSSIRGFFTRNGVLLPSSGKITNGRSMTKKNDSNFAIFRVDPETNMIVSDYSQLRYFLGFLKNRDKMIAQGILSTSQDPIDILGLNVGFVRSQSERSRLLWEGNRTKTGEEFRTFFSKSATADLRRYVEIERNGADDDEPLFVRRSRDNELIRVKPGNLSENFKNASRKAGFGSGKTQNPFRPKRMRSIFSSACYQAGIDDMYRHIFMGHSLTMSAKYRDVPVANLELIFSKVEPFLSIFAEDRSSQFAEAEKKSSQALDLALDLREKNIKLENNVEELREMVLGLNSLVSELDKQMNEFRDSYQSE